MPDNDGEALLSRQSKRRRVDIGVKRTAAAAAAATGARETLLLYDAMNQSHPSSEQGGDCSLVGLGLGAAAAANGEVDKSNVLRKLLKRANSYEDSIISQLLKNNMGKNGGTDSGFQGSGTLSSGGSEIQGEDVCSNPSSRDQDSPSRCLSFSPSLAAPPPSSSSSSTLGRPPPPPPPPPPAAPPPPARSLCTFDLERLTDEHLRAKRARVENIIRGMSHSPLVVAAARSSAAAAGSHGHHDDGGGGGGNHGNGNSGNSVNNNGGIGNRADCVSALLRSPGSRLTGGGGGGGEGYRENKRKQRLPQQQHSFSQLVCSRQELRQEERRQLKLQLEDMQKQLRQLQEKFYQIYDSETEEEENEERPGSRGGGGAEEDGNLSEADSLRSDGLEERRGGGAPSGPRHRRRHDDDDQGPPPCSSSSAGDLDPGVFLDRARALLQGRALMGGGPEMEEEEEEEEEYEEERQAMEEERSARKRRAAAAGGAGGGGGRHLAETLKQELNCAVSQVVDSVVKGFASPKRAHAVAGAALRHGCHGDAPSAAAADAPPPLPPPPSRSSHSSQSNASPSCAPPLYGPLASLAPDLRFTGALGLALHAGGDMSPHPPSYHSSNQRLHCFGDVMAPGPLDSSPFGAGMPTPTNDQTEALSLVVRKGAAGIEGLNPSLPAPPQQPLQAPPPHQHPSLHPSSLSASLGFGPASFRHPFPLPLMGYPFQGPMGVGGPHHGYPGPKEHHMRSSPDSMDMARETVSLRSKMAGLGGGHLSHHHHHHHHHRQSSPSQHGGQEGLSLALIKSECGDLQDLADISPYSGSTIQEGLSPNHLKKAKLMFFYTRYPSSNMLKMFFSDVKFNRCITSQLIKWFSNFREFYYIQMEKFARQAINEGVASADELSISRDAELYRALNMHYNKANDFQVPERFLEVAQVTLREFFNAIVAGKDVDPSWKKAIYKVICKLDSDVPDVFKSPSCLQELLHD